MVPASVCVEAADVCDRVRVAEFGGEEEIIVGIGEGDGRYVLGVVGIGEREVRRHACNEERTGVVLDLRYGGIIRHRIGIVEKRSGQFDGSGLCRAARRTAGIIPEIGTTHAGLIAAHVRTKENKKKEKETNAL